jgi:phage protein D
VNKMLIAAAAAFFAVTAFFGAGAEAAGFNMRLAAPAGSSIVEKAGCGGGYSYFRKRSYRSAHRSVRRKVHVARKPVTSSVSVAKVEPEKKADAEKQVAAVESENSSISTANDKVAEAKPIAAAKPEVKKVAAAKDVGCKQFFPAVGMTLSVSCE